MKLYTSKVVAAWLGLTERRVRQLRDEGVISEKQPGLYDLQATVTKYITFLRNGSGKINLNDERAGLTRAKREAAEMENKLRMGELHRTQDIEAGLKTVFLNIRGRFLALPAKLSPTLASMGGNQTAIFDELKQAIDEALEELSDYRMAFAARAKNEKKDKCKCKGCVWGRKVDDRKYLCLFPFCIKEKGHAKPEQHR